MEGGDNMGKLGKRRITAKQTIEAYGCTCYYSCSCSCSCNCSNDTTANTVENSGRTSAYNSRYTNDKNFATANTRGFNG